MITGNFVKVFESGMRRIVEAIPAKRAATRLRYLADPTAYRREKYSCCCQFDGHGLYLKSPICYEHNNDLTDLNPEYRYVDPPASFTEEMYDPDAMVKCFKEKMR